MRNVITIAINDLRVYFSDRSNLINAFVMPVVLSLVLGVAFGGAGGGAEHIRVDVIDQDGSPLAASFLEQLRNINETLVLCPMDDALYEDYDCNLEQTDDYEVGDALTEDQASGRIEDQVTMALLVIPEGYGTSLQAFEPVQVGYVSDELSFNDAILRSVEAAVQRVNGSVIAARVGDGLVTKIGEVAQPVFADEAAQAAFTQAVYDDAQTRWTENPSVVQYQLSAEDVGAEEAPTGFSQSVPGMATMFVLFNVLIGLNTFIRERQNWTLQRLVMMPVARAELLGGKILARFSTGIVVFALMIVVGLVLGVDFGNDPFALLIVMVAYTLCVTAFVFVLAPFVRTDGHAASVTNLIGLSFAALGGAWWPLEIVPEPMRVVGHLSPVAWAMDAFNELTFYGGGLAEVLPYVGVLLAVTVVLFVIAIPRFKYE